MTGYAVLLFALLFVAALLFAAKYVEALNEGIKSSVSSMFVFASIAALIFVILEQPESKGWISDLLKVLVGLFAGATLSISAAASGNKIRGNNNKIAGRDVNEFFNHINQQINEIHSATIASNKVDTPMHSWFVPFDMRDGEPSSQLSEFYASKKAQGWRLLTVDRDYIFPDDFEQKTETSRLANMVAVFEKPISENEEKPLVYFGLEKIEV